MKNQMYYSADGFENYQLNYLQKALSKREIQVLKLMSEGKSNPQIAKILKISLNTVKAHTEKVYDKLDVGNRAQASVKGIILGIIE